MLMSETMVCKTAVSSASSDTRLVGVLPPFLMTLISALLGQLPNIFSTCLGPKPTPQQVNDDVNAAYDDSMMEYHNTALVPCAHTVRVTARRKGTPITLYQAKVIAHHALEAVRTSNDAAVAEALGASPDES